MKKTLVFFIGMLVLACNDKKDEPPNPVEKTAAVVEPSAEIMIGNQRYADLARQVFGHLSSGNVDQWAESFAEKALYRWNNFDSLSGKTAIGDYWEKRMTETIEKMDFSSEIYLPIQVNKPVENVPKTGTYVMVWNVVTAKYKTGKSMKQRIHTVVHFDDQDKIDYLSQYLDRVPIMAAMK